MIQSREEILQINPVFTTHLIEVQKAKYIQQKFEADEVVYDPEFEKTITLTEEDANRINKEYSEYYKTHSDADPHLSHNKKYDETLNFISSQKEPQAYITAIATMLESLRRSLKQEHLLILGDWSTPWLNQENDYEPVANALNYLKEKVDDDFNGGFVLKEKELEEFIPHLFWLVRCNASLPEFLMSYNNCSFIVSICQYGTVHFEFYDAKEKKNVLSILRSNGFTEVEDCRDYVDFDDLK